MKSPRMSRDVLYVPLYLRSFNLSEKVIVAGLVFISAIAVGSIPLILSSARASEATITKVYGSEAQLWGVLGERN